MNVMPHKILIVDDRQENLYSLESMLAEEGREILKAGSGEEALKIAFREDLSLILLDVQMPEMDGFEVAHMLKSTKRTRKTPIIFVTAISKEKKYLLQGLDEGAIDYLFKPLDNDITRSKVNTLLQFYSQQRELEFKNLELAKLNEEKNYFLGVAAHDLRNPLGNILTLASFIQDDLSGNLTPSQLQYLDVILSSGKHMLDMLHNLLDVSRIESGQSEMKFNDVQVKDLILQVINDNKISAEAKSISIEYSLSDPMSTLKVDTDQIRQVMNNLLSNAIKYSHRNTVIEITAENKPDEVIFSFIDQGQGIPDQEQPKIFEPFHKSSVRSTAGEKSTGLGLTIAKKVIESHGGKIWVKSVVGMGSTFAFSIPLQQKAVSVG